MKTIRRLSFFALVGVLVLGLAGCEADEPDTLGEHVDEAIDDVSDSVEDAADDVQDAAEDAGDKLKDAGEELKQGVQ